jgi:hypothetical protein
VANKAIARTLAFDIQLFRRKSPPYLQTLDGIASFVFKATGHPANPLAVVFASTYIVPKKDLNATGH